MFHQKTSCLFSWGWKWLSLRGLKCLFAPENGIFSSTGLWLEVAAESKDTLGKGMLEPPKTAWTNHPAAGKNNTRSAIDSDIMIDCHALHFLCESFRVSRSTLQVKIYSNQFAYAEIE